MASDETTAARTGPLHVVDNLRFWITRDCLRKPLDGCRFTYAQQYGFKFRIPARNSLAGDVVGLAIAKVACAVAWTVGVGHWHSMAVGVDGLRPHHRGRYGRIDIYNFERHGVYWGGYFSLGALSLGPAQIGMGIQQLFEAVMVGICGTFVRRYEHLPCNQVSHGKANYFQNTNQAALTPALSHPMGEERDSRS
jgi:hypothetical protein